VEHYESDVDLDGRALPAGIRILAWRRRLRRLDRDLSKAMRSDKRDGTEKQEQVGERGTPQE
jgi:hypothetical protein